jgi:hypothetical protein
VRQPVANTNLSFLLPNLVTCGLFLAQFLLVALFFKEPHPSRVTVQEESQGFRVLFRIRKPVSSQNQEENESLLQPSTPPRTPSTTFFDILSLNLALIIGAFAIHQFCSMAYHKLVLIFLNSQPPVGGGLGLKEIGVVLSSSSILSSTLQYLSFSSISQRYGLPRAFSASLVVFTIACFLTPFIAIEGILFWFELASCLGVITFANVLANTCSLILVFTF